MRPSDFLASALLLTTTSAASHAAWAPIQALRDMAPLLRRQDDDKSTSGFDLSFTGKQGNTATTVSDAKETGDATATGDSSDAKATDDSKETGTAKDSGDKSSGTAKQTGAASGKNTKGTSTKTFDARLPAGGISMITPNVMTPKYYKIQDYITFAWNYTSLSVTPSAIDILASCSKNQQTYTLALNQSVAGATQHFTWDTGAFQSSATVPLLTEKYTLIVHDAAKDVTDVAKAGYLSTFNQFTFGMYSPQPYTPMSDYVCATCNSAMSLAEKQTLYALVGMASITVVTCGWFTGVAGLW